MVRPRAAAVLVALVAALSGCGTSSLDGLGNQTFAASAEEVDAAARIALDRLSVTVDKGQKTDTGRWIYAHTADRSINVQVSQVAPGSTRMSVVANGTSGPEDRASASEIIAETAQALEARRAGKPTRAPKNAPQPGAAK